MGIKEDIMQRLQRKKQLEGYVNKKEELQSQNNNYNAMQQGMAQNAQANSVGMTGNATANKALDKGMDAVGMMGPYGAIAKAVYSAYKGIDNIMNTQRNNNLMRSQRHAMQSQVGNENDLHRKQNAIDSLQVENLNRMNAQQKAENANTLNEKLEASLQPQSDITFGDEYEQKNQELIRDAEANNNAETQASNALKQSIMNAVKNTASSAVSAYAGAKGGDSSSAGSSDSSSFSGSIDSNINGSANNSSPYSGSIEQQVNGQIVGYNNSPAMQSTQSYTANGVPSNNNSIQLTNTNTQPQVQVNEVQPTQQQSFEGTPTGYASNIQPDYKEENAPALDYSGSANQELDNNEVQKQSIMNLFKSLGNTVSNGVRDFSEGYQDNSQHGFMEGDLYNGLANNEVTPSQTDDGTVTGGASELKKTLMNRVGELAGTGARVMANPWTQAGIAGVATKLTGGDWADALNNAYSYGTSKATSNYYDRQLNPDKAPSALSRFTKDDYNANTLSRYRDTMADNNSMRVKADLDKNMPTLGDWYNMLLYTGEMSLEDYNKAITAPDYNPTARINIAGYKAVNDKNYKQDSNNIKRTQVNNNFVLGKEKNDIARTNANTNAGKFEENKTHNRNTEGLEEKKYNLAVKEYEQKQQENRQKEIDKKVERGELIRCLINGQSGYLSPNQLKEAKKKYGKGVKVL